MPMHYYRKPLFMQKGVENVCKRRKATILLHHVTETGNEIQYPN